MARVPDIIRRRAISQVSPQAPRAGQGFAALAELAQIGADFVEPAAEKQAMEAGYDATYRDANGKLQVGERNVLGGKFADIHNAAAFSKYMSQRSIDMAESFTEMARNNEFDPAGFKQAADGYISILEQDENIPRALKEDLLASAKKEASRRFNGLYNQETERNYRESDRNTKTHRDMLVDDYVNLYSQGDDEAAAEKLAEIEALSAFRGNAPYISETPAESEAYLRGIRGAAKFSRATRVLTDTKGASSLTDEQRTILEETTQDPDLSPEMRQRLYAATQGRLKGVDAAAFVDTVTDDGYEAKVTRAESDGVSYAKNPYSSATGHHQFVSGTWLENVRELQAAGQMDWTKGMRDDQLLELRKDPATSSQVFKHFRAKNARTLSAAGLPVNDSTEYLAHFLGAGGAVRVLTADPNTKLPDLLSEDAIRSNPFLKNMTVTDLKNWSARKMTMKASDIARQQVAVDQIEDPEVRAMAARQLADRYNIRKRLEDSAAVEYEERIGAKDDSLTQQEILSNHDLGDSAQKALVAELQKQRKDQIAVQQTIGELADETTAWNPYDSKQRSRVDDAYKSILDEDAPLSPAGQTAAGEIALRTGFVPRTMFDALRGAATGNDPEAMATGMEFLNQVIQRQPSAIEMFDGKSAVKNALADYRFYSGFMGAGEAAQRVIDMNAPEAVAKRKNLSDAAKEATKGLKADDLIHHLSGLGVDAELGNETQQAEMMTEYKRLFEDAYLSTGDDIMAANRALTEMSRVYGPNQITGNSRLMKFPPQNFYPRSITNPDWMQRQVVADVNAVIGAPRVTRDPASLAARVSASDIVMLSDETTRREISAGKAPSYTVLYNHGGEVKAVPGRYYFDAKEAQAADAQAEADARRQGQRDYDSQRGMELQADELQNQFDDVNDGTFQPGSFFEDK